MKKFRGISVMMKLSKLLRKYIERSGYTIYGISKRADINRTTLQKILSGDRVPSQELMSKLLPILKLTPSEYSSLLSLFEIQQTGEALYKQRQYIKELLEFVSSVDSRNVTGGIITSNLLKETQGTYAASEHLKRQMLQGHIEIGHAVKDLMAEECRQPRPVMQINIPGSSDLMRRIYTLCAQCSPSYQKLYVQHLTSFIKRPGDTPFPYINLNVLFNTLPLICLSAFRYDIFYYYDNQILTDQERTAFPYYILNTESILFLSADCKTALLCRDADIVYHFRNQFEASIQDAIPMIVSCSSADELLPHLLELDSVDEPLYTLEYQPCLVTYMTDELLRTYATTDIPNYKDALSSICSRARQLRGLTEKVCIFNKTGLLDFAENGRISDIPAGYISPLKVRDRIQVLELLYQGTKKDSQIQRMVNPLTFPISEQLTCILHRDSSLDFNYLNLSNGAYRYIHLTEGTLVEAFSDFFPYLVNSHLVYSKEQTLNFIMECIEDLKQS